MKILSIETSCDETGISILSADKKDSFKVLANALSSQTKIHAQYGGVYPMLAKREHIKNLPILLKKVLKKANIKFSGGLASGIDLIAVTSGPGLEPALWTGIVFAQELGKEWDVPVIPVNHMEGHILSVFIKEKGLFSIPKIEFPALSLLVSGGHTELVFSKDFRKYKIIGETLDDAAGEAFDKVARMLGLPYPGGQEISRLAEKAREHFLREPILKLPRPMLHSKNFDFSFSGLKTAVLYLTQKIQPLDAKKKSAIALEFENAVIETLVHKTKKAKEKYGAKTLIVAGGVSANKYLHKQIKKTLGKDTTILFPSRSLSTDNSLMIAVAGYLKYKSGAKIPKKIKAEGYLRL